MTQRVARPMKFAAFISIIISVAVMLAACQGAVGKAGDKGDKGDPGTPGDVGTPGVSDFRLWKGPVLAIINDVDSGIGPDKTVDLNDYIRGGEEPVKFELVESTYGDGTDEDDAIKKPEVTETGMLTVSLAVAQRTTANYDDVAEYEVTATEAGDDSVTINVVSYRNAAPSDGTGTLPKGTILIGEQDFALDADRTDCGTGIKKLNECVYPIADEDFADTNPTGRPTLTYSAESTDSRLTATVSGGTIKLVASGNTWNKDKKDLDGDAAPGHDPITVNAVATDEGGLSTKSMALLSVTVNARPTNSRSFENKTYSKADETARTRRIADDLDNYFSDLEENELAYTAKSSDTGIVTVPGGAIPGDFDVTLAENGTATVTVRATESASGSDNGIGQWVEATFTVKVTD